MKLRAFRYSVEENDFLEVDPETGVVRLLRKPNGTAEIHVNVMVSKFTHASEGGEGKTGCEETRISFSIRGSLVSPFSLFSFK